MNDAQRACLLDEARLLRTGAEKLRERAREQANFLKPHIRMSILESAVESDELAAKLEEGLL